VAEEKVDVDSAERDVTDPRGGPKKRKDVLLSFRRRNAGRRKSPVG